MVYGAVHWGNLSLLRMQRLPVLAPAFDHATWPVLDGQLYGRCRGVKQPLARHGVSLSPRPKPVGEPSLLSTVSLASGQLVAKVKRKPCGQHSPWFCSPARPYVSNFMAFRPQCNGTNSHGIHPFAQLQLLTAFLALAAQDQPAKVRGLFILDTPITR